jgi:integrin alpha FG-GAP repeat containing protein 1
MSNETTMAAFYDLYQDGILDVILYGPDTVQAFRNTLDYDANFLKVMVLTGIDRGGNLPGPSISCRTTTQDGYPRFAVAAQLPQSAHFPLGLPYTIFGLGRTPKFVDALTVGIAGRSKPWTQIIPNSQMVVIPSPLDQASKWHAQLFITPSRMILMSVAALTGTCVLIIAIIGVLYWKERREDRIEKLQEAHRFHFDAM